MPYTVDEDRWSEQPIGEVEVNREVGDRVSLLVLPGQTQGDVVSGVLGTVQRSTRVHTSQGPALRRPAAPNPADGYYFTGAKPILSAPYTIVVLAKSAAEAKRSAWFFLGDENASPFPQIAFGPNTSRGAAASSGTMGFFEYSGAFQSSADATAQIDGEWHVFAVVRPAGAVAPRLYRDGKQLTLAGSTASASIPATSAFAPYIGGSNYTTADRCPEGDIAGVAVYRGELPEIPGTPQAFWATFLAPHTRRVYFTTGGATTRTVTASLDMLLQRQGVTLGSSLDILIQRQGLTATASLDVMVAKALTVASALDTLVQKQLAATASLDVLAQKQGLTTAASLDLLAQQAKSITASLDLIISSAGAGTLSAYLDMLIQSAKSVSASLDLLVQRSGSVTASADMLVQKARTTAVNLDVLVQKTLAATTSADMLVQLQGRTAVSSIDMLVVASRALVASLDMVVQRTRTLTAVVDLAVQKTGLTASAMLDVIITVAEQLGMIAPVSIAFTDAVTRISMVDSVTTVNMTDAVTLVTIQ